MHRKVLGICGVLLFGSLAGLSGAFAAPVPEPEFETLEMCVDDDACQEATEPAALKVFA